MFLVCIIAIISTLTPILSSSLDDSKAIVEDRCTAIAVAPGATVDGSSLTTHNSGQLFPSYSFYLNQSKLQTQNRLC